MRKQSVLALIAAAVIVAAGSVSAVSAAAAKKAPAKPAAKAPVNTLLGRWDIQKGNAATNITFTDNKLTLYYESEGGRIITREMSYKFSASPLSLDYRTPEGKAMKLSMTYKIKGDSLTYRFLKTNNKEIPGIAWEFTQKRTADGHVDGDTTATRNRKAEEEKARAEAAKIMGDYRFENMNAMVRIFIKDTKVEFDAFVGDPQKEFKYETSYQYSASPLILEYKDSKGKPAKISMQYKIENNKLIYRFLKGGDDFEPAIYKKRNADGKTAVADMVADKDEAH
jgi:opacity protein-like surface antigen